MDFSFTLVFDYLSLFFFSFVCVITSVVFLYRKFYMECSFGFDRKDNSRFLCLLFFFVLSMFFLVFSGSWVVVILGWDGLGLVSFLLVIYYNNSRSLDSGLFTVFSNRVGDCFFIVRFIFISYCGWLRLDFLRFYCCFVFCFFLILGCITKRAQIPFSSWLPAAIAAPTPVSSLVHSSTLVTAGVFLLIRFNFLFEGIFFFLIVISLLTILLSGICANYELDFKKVVAISTLSQLGFIIFSITCGFWLISFLHIVFHALFKRSLFLSTGNLMHYVYGDQDSRLFGSLGASFYSKLLFSIRVLSLIGFPFSLGFYSKDTILGGLIFSRNSFISFIFFVSCAFTVSYSLRLLFLGFFMFPSFYISSRFLEDKFFYYPLIILFRGCVFLGNFFFYFFFEEVVLSFFDLFWGILVIILGYFFFVNFLDYYFLILLTRTMFFLSKTTSSLISSFMKKFYWERENLWGELYGGKGVEKSFLLINLYAGGLYSLFFLSFLFFWVLIFVVVV